MSFLLRNFKFMQHKFQFSPLPLLRLKLNIYSFSSSSYSSSSLFSSTKTSTGITGLIANSNARNNLLSLYCELEKKLKELPEDYGYRKGMLVLLENYKTIIKNEANSDLDVEIQINEGQLEELVEQAHEELNLLEKLANEWKPYEMK